jgi:hypothetical protein
MSVLAVTSPRIHTGMPFGEYRALDRLNFSLLKHLLESTAAFRAAQVAPPKQATPDMLIGSCIDSLILEGKEYPHAVRPEGMDYRSKEGKAWRDSQTLPILTSDERERVDRMVEAVMREKEAVDALHACPERQVSLEATILGVPVKCRLDGANIRNRFIIELKKCQSTSPKLGKGTWGETVYERHYLLQQAIYEACFVEATGSDAPIEWAWLAVSDTDPPVVALPRATEQQRAIGQAQLARVLTEFKAAQKSGKWCWTYFELPTWSVREVENLLLK